jgi:hypothetical protein
MDSNYFFPVYNFIMPIGATDRNTRTIPGYLFFVLVKSGVFYRNEEAATNKQHKMSSNYHVG